MEVMLLVCKYEMEEFSGLLIRFLKQKIIFSCTITEKNELDKKEAKRAKNETLSRDCFLLTQYPFSHFSLVKEA